MKEETLPTLSRQYTITEVGKLQNFFNKEKYLFLKLLELDFDA